MKVVLTYRVLQHWRTPVFRRLAAWPGIDFVALHGADFPGTKVINGTQLHGFRHHQLATIRLVFRRGGEPLPLPLCPFLPFRLAAERPDVILSEGGSNLLNNLLVHLYSTLTHTPVVWWTLGELRGQRTTSRLQKAFRGLNRWLERRATAWLGYSSLALEYFQRQGYPSEAQFRAVNCVDTDRLLEKISALTNEPEQIRDRYQLHGKRVLLFVGALTGSKRLEDLIAAYAALRRKHSDLRLMIVGDGYHRKALEEFAQREGVVDAIFVGHVIEGVAAYFQVGDIFVLPGLGGLAISEAMTHGLPVLATEADGCEIDLVEPGKNGYLLPVGDRNTLIQHLDEILITPGLLNSMKSHSQWIIRHRHNIHTYMEQVIGALQYATQGKKRKSPVR